MRNYTQERIELDERIVQYIEGRMLNVNGIYQDVTRKREFLREVLDYSVLRVGKSEFLPLSRCKDERISIVVKEAYFNAKKRLEEYRRQQRVLRNSGRSLEETVKSVDF